MYRTIHLFLVSIYVISDVPHCSRSNLHLDNSLYTQCLASQAFVMTWNNLRFRAHMLQGSQGWIPSKLSARSMRRGDPMYVFAGNNYSTVSCSPRLPELFQDVASIHTNGLAPPQICHSRPFFPRSMQKWHTKRAGVWLRIYLGTFVSVWISSRNHKDAQTKYVVARCRALWHTRSYSRSIWDIIPTRRAACNPYQVLHCPGNL